MRIGFTSSCALGGLAWTLAAAPVNATPVRYTGWAFTDASLGGTLYKRARVEFTFTGDTNDLVWFDSGVQPSGFEGCGFQIQKGTARVRITTSSYSVTATFNPGQVAVAMDQCSGGAGFVSYFGTQLEPGYPLVFDGWYSNIEGASGLKTTGTWSGNAWSCVGFPAFDLYDFYSPPIGTGLCGDPSTRSLMTDRGVFVIFQRYSYFGVIQPGILYDDLAGSLNMGFFAVDLGSSSEGE
jgi:hypothetical protein